MIKIGPAMWIEGSYSDGYLWADYEVHDCKSFWITALRGDFRKVGMKEICYDAPEDFYRIPKCASLDEVDALLGTFIAKYSDGWGDVWRSA